MKRYAVWGAGGLLWFASLDGALQLQRLPDAAFGLHSVCGPWGCGAPLPALLACHSFWTILIGPPAILAAWYLPFVWVRRLGIGMAAAGICGLAALVGWEAATWLPQVLPSQQHFFMQRCLFSLATLTDVPIVQVLTTGCAFCLVPRPVVRPSNDSSLVVPDTAPVAV